MIRSKEDIKENLTENLNRCIGTKKLWEKVKVITKKDGTPFKNMNQNFVNALYMDNSGEGGHSNLVVDEYFKGIGYVNDSINCYTYKKDLSQLESICALSIEEIKQAIKSRIELYDQKIEHYNNQLEKLEDVFPKVEAIVNKLKDCTKTWAECEGDNEYNNNLYYRLREYIQDNV